MFAGGGTLFEFAGIAFGVREGVIALLALVALYIIVVLWRMRRLRRPPLSQTVSEPAVSMSTAPVLPRSEEEVAQPAPEPAPKPEPLAPPPSLSLSDAVSQRELALLREEVDALRGELAALREDMQQELAHLRAAQTVSPIYGDAMQMAVSGYDAAAIAERCGIARAEADLVVALANSREQ